MRRAFAIIISMCAMLTATATAQTNTVIKSIKGEKWWGLFVEESPKQPLAPPLKVNTRSDSREPLMLSSTGRYIYSSTPIRVEMDATEMSVTSDKAVEVASAGKSLREAYLVACHKNFAPTGKSPAPELFSKIIYYSTAELRANDNQQSLLDYVNRLIAEGFPKGIVVVSDGWSPQPGQYTFDPAYYPTPKQMIDEIHAKGFKVMLSVTPHAPTWGRNFIELKMKSALMTAKDGAIVMARDGEEYFSLFNMTSRSIVDNTTRALEQLARETGVDGFVFDYRAACKVLSGNQLELFVKGMNTMASSFDLAIVNASPCERWSTYASSLPQTKGNPYENLSSTLATALSSSLMGYGNFGMDGASESPKLTDMEMLRTMQLSLFMPMGVVPFAPWRIEDNKLYQEVRRNTNLRAQMGADIAAQAKESARTAEPIMRLMEYQFPREGFYDCTDQYLLVGKYIIAPVVTNATTRMMRVPKGQWQYAPQGPTVKGPRVVQSEVADGRMVVMELVGR